MVKIILKLHFWGITESGRLVTFIERNFFIQNGIDDREMI